MIIYLDMFFLKNTIFNGMLLYLTSFFIRKKVNIIKILIAAILGATYATLALCNQFIYEFTLLKILISVFMLIISFGMKNIKEMLSSFFVIAYIVAGVIGSLQCVNSQIIMLIFAISMMIIFYLYKNNQKNNDYYDLHIELQESEFDLMAKLDTGCNLCDSILGDAVIVVSEEKIKNKIENELIKILNNERLQIPDKYKNKIRLISFKTISGEGIKIGIKLDKVIIYEENKKIETKAVMILTERNFKKYDALIGRNLLEGGYEYENYGFDKIKN